MTKMDKPTHVLAPRPAQGRRRIRGLDRHAGRIEHRARDQCRAGARRKAAADTGTTLLLHRDQCRRQRLGLFRQDGHGPRPVCRDRPDRGGRTRRAVQGRQGHHGRHRNQREPGRRVRLNRRACSAASRCARRRPKRAACWSRWRRRNSALPADDLIVTDGVVHAKSDPAQEGLLRRFDRRALLQRPARLEQEDRQRALCARQGQAEIAEGPQDRRPAHSARRHRAEGLRTGGLLHRCESARHGACAHDPAGDRRQQCRSRSTKARSRTFPAPRWSGTRASSAWSRTRNGTRSRPPKSSRSNGRRLRRRFRIRPRSTITSARLRCASVKSSSRSAIPRTLSRMPRA